VRLTLEGKDDLVFTVSSRIINAAAGNVGQMRS
jgi:hypothetical protein